MNKGVLRTAAGACPGRQELAAFHHGELSAPDLERLAEHLGECDPCAAAVAALSESGLLSGLRRLPGSPPVEEPECRMLEALARDFDLEALASLSVGAEAASAQPDPARAERPVGEFGGYELLAPLAEGGPRVLYRARQKRLNRAVALKVLPPGASTEAKARFLVEGEAVARLRHPGVAQIYELGEHQGRLYFSREYLEGDTLAKQLARGPLGVSPAAELVAALAQAAQAAHAAGVVHRNLKPSNVLLTSDGAPKLADFGLAELFDDPSTLSYLAPEQAAGKAEEVGPPTDVYALGALLYECLTGRPLLGADSRSKVLELVHNAQPVRPSRLREGLSQDLEAVCLKCLEKRPQDRYASAGGLAEDLGRWLKGVPTRTRPMGPLGRGLRLLRSCLRGLVGAALLSAAGLGLGGSH